jgi:hypothetical protein
MDFKELNENLNEYGLVKLIVGMLEHSIRKDYDRIIKKYKKIHYKRVYYQTPLLPNLLRYYKKEINWKQWSISFPAQKKKFGIIYDIDFIREFKDKICWENLTMMLEYRDYNTIEFIREFKDKIDWDRLMWHNKKWVKKLDDKSFLKEFKNYITTEHFQRRLEINDNESY